MSTFSELMINPWLIRQCNAMGVKHPTPVQANCIPEILKGKDCVGAAKTGSGKTLTFALPILQKLCEDPYGIFALILTPTRELAHQIGEQFIAIGKPINLRCSIIIGGMDMVAQGLELSKNPHIVVATPGRLVDHLEGCNTFSLSHIKFLVLDEADRLLGGHFDEQIKRIFQALPKKRQNLFFSATITDALDALNGITGNEIFYYDVPAEVATVDQLEQYYVVCPKDVRDAYLVEIIRNYRSKSSSGNIMIFTNSCRKCQILSMMLNDVGFENVALHSMIKQRQRLASIIKFKSNSIKILIATDVASRGLDISAVQLVINHVLPNGPKEYIHRVGRTARAGSGGQAISLISPDDVTNLQQIENHINKKLSEFKVNDKEVGKIFTQISVSESEAFLTLDEQDFFEKRKNYRRKKWILEGLDPDEEEAKLLKKPKKTKKPKKANAETKL